VYQMFVNHSYIENLGLTLMAGAGFPEATPTNETSIIVNETLLKKFNLGSPFDALNKSLRIGNQELRISGIVKDFNYMPLREEIQSFFFRTDPRQFRYANVKLRSTDIQATLEKIAQSWKVISDQKFEARFLDDEVNASLVSYRSMIKIFGFLGLLAVTISCLGLLAVVISTAESRTKEMGIRKIMGATMADLALNLSRNFLKLIGIAVMIGTPVTYIIFDKIFLRMNYYRAAIGISEIASGILLLLLLTSVIIGSQTLKVARINPVETLKYE
jgi:putative ABC transport system permease protein